jgi:ribokinase
MMRILSRSASIFVVGSINMDIFIRVLSLPAKGETVAGHDAELMLGGKGANQAIAAHLLGGEVKFLAGLGKDTFGAAARQALIDLGLELRLLKTIPGVSTGIAMITVDQEGQNMIALSPGANAHLHRDDVDAILSSVNKGDILLLQNEISADVSLHIAERMKQKGGFIIVDPAPAQNFDPALIPFADIITPNETEATALTGLVISDRSAAYEAARALVKAGAKAAVIKMGAAGVIYAGCWGEGHVTAPQVQAIDTVAAGDCFNGALAVAMSEGKDFRNALNFACTAASISVTRKGAANSMPRREDMLAL